LQCKVSLSYGGATARYFAAVPEAGAGEDAVELDEPDSLLLTVFDSDFDSVLAPESVLTSPPVFFSADEDSVAELPPVEELPLAA